MYNQLPKCGEYIWKCNFSRNDVDKGFPNLNNCFWKDVIKSWADYNFHTPITCSEIMHQNIWFNSHITINNQILFYIKWFRAGIQKVSDLFNRNGDFLSLNTIVTKYNIKIDFLNWCAIKKAIPTHWVSQISLEKGRNEQVKIYCRLDELKRTKKSVSKVIYSNLMVSEYLIPIDTFSKWANELDIDYLDEGYWLEACQNIKLNTVSSSHRTFQIRYYNRILATNEKLCKMGIIENNKCSFCGEEIESLVHLFWNCKIIKIFWTRVLAWISSVIDTKIVFKVEEILFHCPLNDPLPFNFLFSLARQHIYFCRNKQRIPNLFNYINFLNVTKQMEFVIATKNNTVSKFSKKWGIMVS